MRPQATAMTALRNQTPDHLISGSLPYQLSHRFMRCCKHILLTRKFTRRASKRRCVVFAVVWREPGVIIRRVLFAAGWREPGIVCYHI